MSEETWKPIPSLNREYEASNYGRIRALWICNKVCKKIRLEPKILSLQWDRKGYRTVTIKRKTIRVARAVCEAFHGKPMSGMVCDHKNNVRHDDKPENLHWVTPQQNQDYRKSRGTYHVGTQCRSAKLNDKKVMQIRQRYANGERPKNLGIEYGVARENIHLIVNGSQWKHLPIIQSAMKASLEGEKK